jgi:hypothetical protein
MTTNTTTTTTTATTTVDELLDAIRSGAGIPAALYADGAVLDATVPNWRFTVAGPEAIAAEYTRWFAHPAATEELDRFSTADGVIVRYLLTWREHGVPHAAHHAHLLTLDSDGRISKDVVFCGGRWDAALLAQMEEAQG